MVVRNRVVRTCVTGLAAWLAGGGLALGQATRPPESRPSDPRPAASGGPPAATAGDDMTVVVRTYNISDLVRTVPDYPLPPEADKPGKDDGGGTSPDDDTADDKVVQRVEGLIRLIQTFTAPDSWRDTGGSVGAIHQLDPTLLVINQIEANHRAIQSLLDTVRRDTAAGTVVEVEARWVLLTPDQVDAWRAAERKGDGGEAVRALAREMSRDEKSLYCRATALCFNGQTVGVTSGRAATVVTAASPTVGQSAALYEIRTGRDRSGVSLQVTPRFAADRGTVTVDVYSVVAEDAAGGAAAGAGGPGAGAPGPAAGLAVATAGLGVSATQPAAGGLAADATRRVVAALERPARYEQRFRTTVRVRPGTPAIIGGMTQEPGKPGSRQLCV
jgi:hypothetical protein